MVSSSTSIFANIISEINKNTLIAFDLDYTLFRSRTSLGTPEWFLHLLEQEVRKGESKQNSFKKWYPIWIKAQKFNKIVLMDQQIPIWLKKIKENSLGYMALTARHPASKKVTQQQLQKVGLNFNKNLPVDITFNSKFEYPTLFSKGILFTHDLNDKSQVFIDWFKQITMRCTEHLIKKIIFIDDLKANVTSMENAIKKLNLEHVCIHYTAGDIYKINLDPKLVEYQANILAGNHSNKEIKQLLQIDECVE